MEDKLQTIRKQILQQARQHNIKWSVLELPWGEQAGFLGELDCSKNFDLALLEVINGYQLWAVRKDKTRSIYIPGNNQKLVQLAQQTQLTEED